MNMLDLIAYWILGAAIVSAMTGHPVDNGDFLAAIAFSVVATIVMSML